MLLGIKELYRFNFSSNQTVSIMKVTICELSDNPNQFQEDWVNLTKYTTAQKSDLVLLPEMPFHQWIASQPTVDESIKTKNIASHELWLKRIPELNAKIVAYSKPVQKGNKYYNTAFIWTKEKGHQKVRSKYFFPEEDGFFEATWFDRDDSGFELIEVDGIKIGFLLCTEIWFTQYARKYGLAGIDLLLCPRATGQSSVPQWIRCGQTLSVISGSLLFKFKSLRCRQK